MAGGRLKITQPGLLPRECQVELDGHDISHACRGIELVWNPGEVTEAKLTILVNHLEVDSGVLAMIQAHVRDS